MGMYIGDVYLPYVSDFSVDKAKKKTEIVKHCDRRVAPHLAEFQPDFREAKIAGTLLNGTFKTVDQYAEDILGAVDRSAAYNFIDFENRAGWLSLNDPDIPESADSVLRKYSLSGQFLPKAKYQPRFRTSPTILANDFSLTLGSDGCDSYVALPVGATYAGGDGAAITRTGADGTITLVKATTNNDIRFDVSGDEVDVGEVKVWDDMGEASEANWVRVFNPDHVFQGDYVVIENGLMRLKVAPLQATRHQVISLYYWDTATSTWVGSTGLFYREGTAWSYDLGIYDGSIYYWLTDASVTFEEMTPDKAKIKLSFYKHLTGYLSAAFDVYVTLYRGAGMHVSFDGHNAWSSISAQYRSEGIGGGYEFGVNSSTPVNINLDPSKDLIDSTHEWGILFNTTQKALNVTSFVKDSPFVAFNQSQALQILTPLLPSDEFYVFLQDFDTSKLFMECESMTLGSGATYYTGTDASPKTGNTGSTLNASGENVEYPVIGHTDLPAGTYKLFVRAKDTAQVADDMRIEVYNQNDGVHLLNVTKTLTSAWAYYSGDVTLDADDAGDTIRVILKKDTATANTIDLDYVLWVPISLDSKNGPQDLAHQAMVDQRLTRELVGR